MDWKEIVRQVLELQSDPGLNPAPGPAFQFYPRQWLGDDLVDLMGMTARGVHMNLMLRAWQQELPCSVPDEPELLRGWCRMEQAEWERVWPEVSRAWRFHDGRYWQIGLCREYLSQMSRRRQSRKAARKRWGEDPSQGGSGGAAEGGRDATAMRPHSDRNATASNQHALSNALEQCPSDALGQCTASASASASASADCKLQTTPAKPDPPLNPPRGGGGDEGDADDEILIPCTGVPGDPTAREWVSPRPVPGLPGPMWCLDARHLDLQPPPDEAALRWLVELRSEIVSGARSPPTCRGAKRVVRSWLRGDTRAVTIPEVFRAVEGFEQLWRERVGNAGGLPAGAQNQQLKDAAEWVVEYGLEAVLEQIRAARRGGWKGLPKPKPGARRRSGPLRGRLAENARMDVDV